MEQIEDFHRLLLYIITAICLFVLALLVWIVDPLQRSAPIRCRRKVHHNTLLEVAWTIIPVIILVVIAIPSFRLLYFEADIPKPDVTIKAIGKQWFWTYEYPGATPASPSTRSACPTPTPPRRASRACWASTTSSTCR